MKGEGWVQGRERETHDDWGEDVVADAEAGGAHERRHHERHRRDGEHRGGLDDGLGDAPFDRPEPGPLRAVLLDAATGAEEGPHYQRCGAGCQRASTRTEG